MRRYYVYGRDYFTDGLPEGSIGHFAPDLLEVQAVIDTMFPPPDKGRNRIDSAILDRLYPSAFAAETLRDTTGWNPATGDIGYPLDNPTEIGTVNLEQTEYVSPTKVKVFITLPPSTSTGSPIEVSEELTITSKYPMDETKSYYMIGFTVIAEDGSEVGYEKFWNYDPSSQDHPTLIIPPEIQYTQYMPIVPLRINNKNLTDPSLAGTPLYDTSKKLLKKIDLKMEELDEGVNQNPDIEQIDHAYVVMGISIFTDKPESDLYLYRFFDDLEDRSFYSKKNLENWQEAQKVKPDGTPPPVNTIRINDGTYDSRIVYYYINKTTEQASLGKVGEVFKTITPWTGRLSFGNERDSGSMENPDNKIILKQQVTPTTVDVITVSGPIFVNNIYGGRDYITTIEKKEEDNFIIPLNLSITEQMDLLDRNTLYYDAMKIVFHAFEWTKLKWYQTGFFKFVVIVLSVAVTIYTGYDWGLSSLAAAASAGAVAFGTFILQQAIIYAAVSVGFKYAAEELGVEFAAILAVVAMAYGVFGAESLFSLPMADSLLFLGTMALDAALTAGYEMLGAEYEAFASDVEAKQEELEAAQALLENDSMIDPMNTFLSVGMLPGETPSAFTERSLMVNQGISSIEMVSDFVDTHLLLPTPRSYYA